MKSEIIFFARLVPVVVCLVAIATGQDRIHLNSGEVIEGRIDLVTDEHIRLNIRIETSSGRGEGRRVLPVDLVEWIDFQPSPLEIKLIAGELKESDLLALQKEVSEGIKRVVHPRSRTGDLAIAWGRLLLLNGDSTALQEGIRWLDGVIGSDWDAQRRDQARIVQ